MTNAPNRLPHTLTWLPSRLSWTATPYGYSVYPKCSDIRFSPLLIQVAPAAPDYSNASRAFYDDDVPNG